MRADPRILITGAAGFIGGSLARRFAGAVRLVLLDRLRIHEPPGGARVLTGELTALTPQLSAEPTDIVYHCAGITAAACEADPDAAWATNVEGTRALLAWCAGLPRPPRFVFTSTVAVFGGGERVVTEASQVEPASTYGATKAAAEQVVLDASRRGVVDGVVARLPVTIVRPSRIGRPGAGFLSDLIVHAASGGVLEAPLAADRAIPVASLRDTLDQLVRLGTEPLGASRIRHVPSLAMTANDVLAALAEHGVAPRPGQVAFAPDAGVERLIAGWPDRLASLHGPQPEPLQAIVADHLASPRA